MAVTLKQGVPILRAQAIAERLDGSRVAFMPQPAPMGDKTRNVTGAVNLLVDVTDRITAETRLAAIVASSGDAIVGKTLDGVVRSRNSGAQRIFGHVRLKT
jgi:two-component system, chemotaxis family, CheB/CheR fusion protein